MSDSDAASEGETSHAEFWEIANRLRNYENELEGPGADPPASQVTEIRERLEEELADREGIEVDTSG